MPKLNKSWKAPARLKLVLALILFSSGIGPSHPEFVLADSDVYNVLPADTRVLQYDLADFDGDAVEELAILYTTADETRLTLFKGDSGHWSRWWDDNGAIDREDESTLRSLETVDINGDGRAEILVYYLTDHNMALATRILSLGDPPDPADPIFKVILEDTTSPPGYPVLGMEGENFSVTFMRMASGSDNGFRRVYCWNGEAFEKCKEVVWELP